jgi:hypothetical protein
VTDTSAPLGPADVGALTASVPRVARADRPAPDDVPARRRTARSGIEVPSSSGALEDVLVARARPVQVTIPSLGVVAPVGPASVEGTTHQLAIPPDAASVVWYRHGPSPGQAGSAVLAGHVDWNDVRGAFFGLSTVLPGAEITVAYDDGSTARFVVAARRAFPKPELPLGEIFATTGAPRLTLVKCGGSFDRTTRHYRDKVVVVAEPVS